MYPLQLGIIASVNKVVSPFTPADLPGLVDWWTASSGVTFSSGTNVLNWVGNNGKNLTYNPNYANTPSYNASDTNYNNQPSITFSTSSMYMDTPYSGVTNPTLIVIGNIGNTTGNYNGIVGLSQVPGFNNFDRGGRMSLFNKDANNINVFSDPPNSERNMAATGWKDGVYYFEYGFDNANNLIKAYSNNGFINQDSNMTYNGTFNGGPGSDTTCDILFISDYGANIGGSSTNTYTDVIYVDRILSSEERLLIIEWARGKYGFPNPSPPKNSLKAWFKSDAGVNISSGLVTSWESQYGISGLIANTQTVSPTLTEDLNGYTAVTMPSGSLPMLFNTTLSVSSAFTIFTVIKSEGTYAEYALTRSGGGMAGISLTPGFGGPGMFLFDGGSLAIGGQNLTTTQYLTWQSSSAGSNLRQSGNQVVTGGSQVTANPNGLFSNNSTGNISMWETLIYDAALTPAQILEVETYLATKYALASDPNAQAYIEKVLDLGGTLTTTEKQAVNQLTIDLKAAGVYNKCDLILPILGGNAASSKVNLVDPTNATTDWTYLGTLGFSSTGIKGNNIDGAVRSNFKINDLTKATLGDAHYASYRKYYPSVVQGSSTGNNEDGAIDSEAAYARFGLYGYSGGGIGGMYANNYSSGLAASNFNGLMFANTTSSTFGEFFINNSLLANSTATENAFTANTGLAMLGVYWWSFNLTRVYGRSPDEVRFYSVGSGLNSTERTALYNAINTYQTTLGRNV